MTAEDRRAGSISFEHAAVATLPRQGMAVLLQILALEARVLTQAAQALLGVGFESRHGFVHSICSGSSEIASELLERLSSQHGLPTGGLRDVVRTQDVRGDPNFRDWFARYPDSGGVLGVPIFCQTHPVGCLWLVGKRHFSPQDERLAQMLAARASVAITTAPLYEHEAQDVFALPWLKAVIDQMPEGIVIVDAQSQVVLENFAARAFDRDADTNEELCYPSGRGVPLGELPIQRAVLGRESTIGMELVAQSKTRAAIPILQSAAPIEIDSRLFGAVAILQEIGPTEERACEERVSVLGHDLRQPLNVITLAIGMVQRSNRAALSGEQCRALDRIQAAAARLDKMIDHLVSR